jgi:hypothetical protein
MASTANVYRSHPSQLPCCQSVIEEKKLYYPLSFMRQPDMALRTCLPLAPMSAVQDVGFDAALQNAFLEDPSTLHISLHHGRRAAAKGASLGMRGAHVRGLHLMGSPYHVRGLHSMGSPYCA